MLFVLSLSPALSAQMLPVGDGRNNDFVALIDKIKADNHITESAARQMPIGTKYKLPDGTPEKLVEGDGHGIWGHEFSKYYGVPYEQFLIDGHIVTGKTPSEKVTYVAPPANTASTASSFPWWILGVALALILALVGIRLLQVLMRQRRTLREDPQDATLQGTPMRSRVATALGLPTTQREHIHTATALLAHTNEDRQRRGQAPIVGNLAEIVEVGVRSTAPVTTEYADRNRGARPDGQRVALGVFRNDSGVIETVTFHFSACDNGMLFNRMPTTQVEEFVRTATWAAPRRIYVSPAYRTRPLNWQEILGWINANLAGTASQSAASPIRTAQQSAPSPAPATSVAEVLTPANSVSISIGKNQLSVPVGTGVRITGEKQMEVSVPGPCTITFGATPVTAATPAVDAPKVASAS